MPFRRLPLALSTLAVVVAAMLGTAAASGAGASVHLRGTAYEFNNVELRLAGATIRVAELPKLKATVRPDGTYDLAVPDDTAVTPYIEAAGHHTIYLQTFTTAGEDLENVNFQTPSDAVYRALVDLLKVPVDANGDPAACAIVSTFSTKDVRDLSYADFIAYGAHGVAGATASAKPALPAPTYFNANVIPDPAQVRSSKDGGVVWTGVPAGTYTITAHHPTRRFASFVASCRPGRVVNANPPWGLHELAPPSPARVAATWAVDGSRVVARTLRIRRLPAKAVVRVSCSGARCPFIARAFRPTATTLDLRRALGASSLRLRAGQTLEVDVSAHGFDGLAVQWRIAAGRTPAPTTLCIPLGDTRARARC